MGAISRFGLDFNLMDAYRKFNPNKKNDLISYNLLLCKIYSELFKKMDVINKLDIQVDYKIEPTNDTILCVEI